MHARAPGTCWLVVAAVVLASGAACTHAPWNPYRGWRAWKTANVTVYADAVTAPTLTQEFLEDSYAVLAATFFQGVRVPPVEVIEIQASSDSPFLTDSGYRKLEVAVPALRIGPGNPRSILIVGGDSDRWDQTHVLAHHFIEAAVPDAPLWLHEGLAVYLSGFRGHASRKDVMCFGIRRPGRAPGVIEPLPALFALTWQDHNDRLAPSMSRTAWALVDYLLHATDRVPVPEFRALMTALKTNGDGRAAIAAAFTPALAERLDVEVPAHSRRVETADDCPLRYPAVPVTRPRGAAVVSDVPEAEVKSWFDALSALPDREGHADFYPPAITTALTTAR